MLTKFRILKNAKKSWGKTTVPSDETSDGSTVIKKIKRERERERERNRERGHIFIGDN